MKLKIRENFKGWKCPKPTHGRLTPWNWLVQHPHNLEIGEYSDIGAFTYINAKNGVILGKYVEIGSHCSIYSISTIDGKEGTVVIGENSMIGSHSTIMPGVKIGRNCVIGAHSFVNKDIPDNSIAYGVPCKVVKENENE